MDLLRILKFIIRLFIVLVVVNAAVRIIAEHHDPDNNKLITNRFKHRLEIMNNITSSAYSSLASRLNLPPIPMMEDFSVCILTNSERILLTFAYLQIFLCGCVVVNTRKGAILLNLSLILMGMFSLNFSFFYQTRGDEEAKDQSGEESEDPRELLIFMILFFTMEIIGSLHMKDSQSIPGLTPMLEKEPKKIRRVNREIHKNSKFRKEQRKNKFREN
ncbi:unnamed protein product [Moneuplotes crassus]|uniref:Uncharacterized protein n=1 Tax=Euplotes crassus TaxID=5936 RepID=A0AAD1XRB5_EUPCR|nr:unnamed protein product [Moneuplotes crassus]